MMLQSKSTVRGILQSARHDSDQFTGNNDAVNRAKASITRVAFGGRGRRNED